MMCNHSRCSARAQSRARFAPLWISAPPDPHLPFLSDGHSKRYCHQKHALHLESTPCARTEMPRNISVIRSQPAFFQHKMTESLKSNRLKKVKAVFPGPSKSSHEVHSAISPETACTVRRILRILLKNPQDDYEYVMHLDQGILALRKGSSFKIVSIQQFQCAEILQQTRILSGIQHPNVASIYDVYCFDEKHFLIMEHLSIRISHLEIQKHELEEWEIATIISEVVGICHLE